MASLSPIEMSSINHKILAAWFESLVTELRQSSWITFFEAERAERQYKELLENKDAMKEKKLFEMKDIPLSDWRDSSKSSDYVPESTPSSDNIQSESQTKKYTKRPRKKWINIFIVDLKKKLFDINNFWLLCYLDLTIFTK